MTLTDEQIQRLRALPGGVFRVMHVLAIAGDSNDPPRRVCVYAKVQPSVAHWHDDPQEIVQFNEGDEIELVPHANWGSQRHGPHCACPDCTKPFDSL